MQGVEEAVKLTNLGLDNYVKESRERLLTAARFVDIDLIESIRETTIEAKKQKKEERTISWEEKMLHCQLVRQTKEVGNQDKWQWLRNGTLKRETEQEQTKYRICSNADETINHIVNECPKLAQREYKRRHDRIGGLIHWEICGANGIHVKSKWYEHQPQSVIENDSCKILRDFTVQTDHFITARRPDMVFIDKEHHECQIIEFTMAQE